jgi:hypothetical protein
MIGAGEEGGGGSEREWMVGEGGKSDGDGGGRSWEVGLCVEAVDTLLRRGMAIFPSREGSMVPVMGGAGRGSVGGDEGIHS